jgi:signal transduction histidine kinase
MSARHRRRCCQAALLGLAVCAWPMASTRADDRPVQPPRATQAEAVAMVKKAIAQYKRDGAQKTFADIMDLHGGYRSKDLYVWVTDLNTGFTVAHGVNPRMLGKNLTYIRDADGRAFVLNLQKFARAGQSGWVDYKWPNPVSNVIESKTTYVEPLGNLAFCAGVYQPAKP